MTDLRDKFWVWGHKAGSYNNGPYRLKGPSRMTAAEGAYYLGVPNLIMVRYSNEPQPPFDQYAEAFRPLKRVIWSIVGDSGTSGNDLPVVLDLAKRFPNIRGVIMDDFFQRKNEKGEPILAPHAPRELDEFKQLLIVNGKRLDLWVVLYDHQLDLPVAEHINRCDMVTFWTWKSRNLERLEENFRRVEDLSPCRKVLGIYMYDFGDGKEIPLPLMEKQCELGLRWLQEGKIEGMIFLGSCICDLGLEAVEWTRKWIQRKD